MGKNQHFPCWNMSTITCHVFQETEIALIGFGSEIIQATHINITYLVYPGYHKINMFLFQYKSSWHWSAGCETVILFFIVWELVTPKAEKHVSRIHKKTTHTCIDICWRYFVNLFSFFTNISMILKYYPTARDVEI